MCAIIILFSALFLVNEISAVSDSKTEQSDHKRNTGSGSHCQLTTLNCGQSTDFFPETQDSQVKYSDRTDMAVVLYNEESILPLHKMERSFHFVNRDIKIKQNWSGLGVAAVVWDAAVVLCQFLESNPLVVKDKNVIELGAGTGLVGMVSAFLGGKTTITDRPAVLEFLRTSVKDNSAPEDASVISVTALDWTQDLKEFKTYDVILGADIVYIEDVFDDLLRTLSHLSKTDTVIYLSCRIRYDRDTNFLSKMKSDFEIQEILYDSKTDVKLFKAKKR